MKIMLAFLGEKSAGEGEIENLKQAPGLAQARGGAS